MIRAAIRAEQKSRGWSDYRLAKEAVRLVGDETDSRLQTFWHAIRKGGYNVETAEALLEALGLTIEKVD
jgi:hypothetical protein